MNHHKSSRVKMVVLDANFYWTEQLFAACHEFADILLLKPLDFRTFKKRYGSYFSDLQPRQIAPHVWEQRICCPPGWLFHYWGLTRRLLAGIVRRFQGSDLGIFVFCYPHYHKLAAALNLPSIYYSIDRYNNYWPGRDTQTEAAEHMAIECADLVLCVAEYRAKLFQSAHPNRAERIVHIPHGCSPTFMVERPLVEPKALPPLLKDRFGKADATRTRPIAGYIGALIYRFDFHYLAAVAAAMPDVTFVLGGEIPQPSDGSREWWQGVETARSLTNIHFIDTVPHQLVGEYLQSFDVLLMPYSECEFNLNACPMKLWDYMGTSLPIVANDVVPEVNRWSDLILIASDPAEFAKNIRFALANPTWKAEKRLATAKANTWHQQAERLYQILEEHGWLTTTI